MARYEVTEVSPDNTWENKYGKYQTFLVRFQGDDEQVQINRKFIEGQVKEPKVGDQLDGTIEITDKGKKFKQDYSGGSGGSTPAGGAHKKPDGPSEEYWASKDARISRQWALGRGIELLAANKEAGQLITVEQVVKVADELEKHLPELKRE